MVKDRDKLVHERNMKELQLQKEIEALRYKTEKQRERNLYLSYKIQKDMLQLVPEAQKTVGESLGKHLAKGIMSEKG